MTILQPCSPPAPPVITDRLDYAGTRDPRMLDADFRKLNRIFIG